MQRRRTLVSTFVVMVAVPVIALAHHGWNEYDASQPLKLTGTIDSVGYENPHGFVMLKASDKTWEAILAPPSRMESRGLTRDLLKAGATATIEGFPSKKKPDEMRAERVIIEGKTVELR